MECFAHTTDDGRPWEPLVQHLAEVAERAQAFAKAWGAHDWAQLAGIWHDLGKYSEEFQGYLRKVGGNEAVMEDQSVPGKVDHSTAGSRVAVERLKELGLLLAYPIAGHHGGLPNWDDEFGHSGLRFRLDPKERSIPSIEGKVPAEHLRFDAATLQRILEKLPQPKRLDGKVDDVAMAFRLAFWTRMLFSSLVDADFLATEAFMNPEQAAARPQEVPAITRMEEILLAYLKGKMAQADDTPVNRVRREILDACLAGAQQAPGFFSLAVPTGGGKTLSGLAFALRHARIHGLRRVVMAVPFTSIIEQNAEVYRRVFEELGDEAVLEHHSNLGPEKETFQSRLASENWDASLVVTTNVQLFESLFANRTSPCRKLHRLARSVIVLDEAQTIPVELLQPTLAALRELVEVYGCTVVLCSATQPAIAYRPPAPGDPVGFPIGIKGVREIMPPESDLHSKLRRAWIAWVGERSDEGVVSDLLAQKQVLCVVNSRPHAAKLFTAVCAEAGKGAFHLSTRMCAAHRSEVIGKIRQRLAEGKTCRVVSTQLIEAGVDVDFPVVYRALAGLDSITQAAGRCNREGRRETGDVFVFDPEAKIPAGYLRHTADTTRELLAKFSDDLASPEAVRAYFEMHYWKKSDDWDKKRIGECFRMTGAQLLFQFKECAGRFRMIEDGGKPVLVPYGKEGKILTEKILDGVPPNRMVYRLVQRFTVSVRAHELERLLAAGAVTSTADGMLVLAGPRSYDSDLGLLLDGQPAFAADDLII